MLLKIGVFRWCWQENITASPRVSQCLKEKISFFYWEGWSGVCAKRDVTQEGSREQTWQSLMVVVGGGWKVGGSEKVILAWRDYWIASKYSLDHRIIRYHSQRVQGYSWKKDRKRERKIVSDKSDLLRDFLGRKPINKS